jgi:hypothetical protein
MPRPFLQHCEPTWTGREAILGLKAAEATGGVAAHSGEVRGSKAVKASATQVDKGLTTEAELPGQAAVTGSTIFGFYHPSIAP